MPKPCCSTEEFSAPIGDFGVQMGDGSKDADRWFCTQNSKRHFLLAYILTGISHRVFGVDRGVVNIDRMLILIAEMDPVGVELPRAVPWW